jgi:hypothetical protein
VSIRVACAVFGISESCCRYEKKLSTESEEIADCCYASRAAIATGDGKWLVRAEARQRESARRQIADFTRPNFGKL